MDPELQPVIVGVGECVDREDRLQPVDLMLRALGLAQEDAGAALLRQVDSLELLRQVSWPYASTLALLCEGLGHRPPRAVEHPVGGETPVAALHGAARRIAGGRSEVALVVGGEAAHSVRRAERDGRRLDWHRGRRAGHARRAADSQRPLTRALGLDRPAHAYPLYENALTAAWQQSPAQAMAESAALWSALSCVAVGRDCAWSARTFTAEEIATPGPGNRLVAWPYPKLMTANPQVNQAAAVLLVSRARARRAGIPERRQVPLAGGAAAAEPDDLLQRARYDAVPAQTSVLGAVQALTVEEGFGAVELYSCFPCVPKLARRTLGLPLEAPLSLAGGLTFFGGPLNAYMLHATVAMVQALRARPQRPGLLYGQGGWMTRHHALVLGGAPGSERRALARRVAVRPYLPPAPPLDQDHRGPAWLETFSLPFDRNGRRRHAVALCRTAGGARVLAKVAEEESESLDALMSMDRSPVGLRGRVVAGAADMPEWRLG